MSEYSVSIFLLNESQMTGRVTGPAGSVVEHPHRDREVVGSNPGIAIPKALKWYH